MPNNYATFEIEPLARHAQAGGTIKRPVEIACFSYDEEHRYHSDSRSLRYYYTPSTGVELAAGFETFRDLDVTDDEHLDALLLTLENLEREKGDKVDTEFVTWRGMCTKVSLEIVKMSEAHEGVNMHCKKITAADPPR
jgi:RAT1-interacting protein